MVIADTPLRPPHTDGLRAVLCRGGRPRFAELPRVGCIPADKLRRRAGPGRAGLVAPIGAICDQLGCPPPSPDGQPDWASLAID